jgi:hypothetical protein
VEDAKRWRLAIRIAVVIWVALVVRLMIADVWDETNGMLYFSASNPLAEKLKFVLTQSLGFWRPLATLIPAITLHFIPSFDVSWRIVRAINIVMLVGALAFFLDAAKRWSPSDKKHFLFTIAFLFSGSAIIAAGWYANVFDVSALLLIALGTSMLARDKPLIAGILFGLAFFAKETAILSLPSSSARSTSPSARASCRSAQPPTCINSPPIASFRRSPISPKASGGRLSNRAASSATSGSSPRSPRFAARASSSPRFSSSSRAW